MDVWAVGPAAYIAEEKKTVKEWWQVAGFGIGAGRRLG